METAMIITPKKAVTTFCEKYSLNEKEFASMFEALSSVEERHKKEVFIICAEFVAKKIAENQK